MIVELDSRLALYYKTIIIRNLAYSFHMLHGYKTGQIIYLYQNELKNRKMIYLYHLALTNYNNRQIN